MKMLLWGAVFVITYPFAKLYEANNKLLTKIRELNRGE